MKNTRGVSVLKLTRAMLFCGLGLCVSLLLQQKFGLPNFTASALVGLLGSFLPESRFYARKEAVASLYTGSFASMCSIEVFSSNSKVILLGFLTGFSFYLLSFVFRGFGGKLGTAAFLASLGFVLSLRLM